MVSKFNGENFDEEVKNFSGKVLVDFYADWCGPCKMMAPIIDEIAKENIAGVKVGKVNCDENMELTQQYKIMSIPTIIIFKDGQIVKSFVGVTDKEQILSELKQ